MKGVEMTSLLTLVLACLPDSKDNPCSKKKFSYLDLSVATIRKALFYHAGDMRIGTNHQLISQNSCFFISSVFHIDKKKIIVVRLRLIISAIILLSDIFVCIWSVTERWQPSCLARRFIVCADTCARILTCQLEISSEKTPCEANRQKISLAELASNWKENKQVRNKWLRPQGGGNGGRYKS